MNTTHLFFTEYVQASAQTARLQGKHTLAEYKRLRGKN